MTTEQRACHVSKVKPLSSSSRTHLVLSNVSYCFFFFLGGFDVSDAMALPLLLLRPLLVLFLPLVRRGKCSFITALTELKPIIMFSNQLVKCTGLEWSRESSVIIIVVYLELPFEYRFEIIELPVWISVFDDDDDVLLMLKITCH